MSKIYVTQPLIPPIEDFINETRDIFDSKWFTNMGAKHQELEEKLKEYLKLKHISLTVNGHLALELSIQALGLKNKLGGKGEVITTPFTFISTTHSIVRNGLKPVFADIDPATCCITPESIEPLINQNTVAIMPVHVYGNICDVEGIEELAKKHNLKVIYDAAHAFGVEIKDRQGNIQGVGSFGDISMFSFHATKVYNTIEGGAACFSDPSLEKKLYNLKDFGIRYGDPDYIEAVGANAKMNEFQAAMGLANLRYVDDAIKSREHLAKLYNDAIGDIYGINLPIFNKSKSVITRRNYAYMPIVFDTDILGAGFRDRVMEYLKKHDVYARKYFYPLTNDAQCYKGEFSSDGANDSNPTPVAKKISSEVLTLPLYATLKDKDVILITDLIKELISIDAKK